VTTKREIDVYVPCFRLGGAQRVMINLAHGFRDAGVETRILVNDADGPLRSFAEERVKVTSFGSDRMRYAFPALCRHIGLTRPYCVVSAVEEVNVATILASILTFSPTRVVVTVHSILSSSMESSAGARRLVPLVRRLYRRAHAVVAVSEGVREDLVLNWGLASDRVVVIPNPIVTEEIARLASEPTSSQVFDSAAGQPRILGLGRLDLLIRALVDVRRHIAATLFIVGEGPEEPFLRRVADEAGVSDHVHFLGSRVNPFPFIKGSDVVVLPSRSEGLGAVLVEAMALGRPVVASDSAGTREVLQGGRYGVLAHPDSAEGLALAIMRQIERPLDYDSAEAVARFDVGASAAQYLRVCFAH
jgi:glycosyltransferase involved in cell wall biosynthesis